MDKCYLGIDTSNYTTSVCIYNKTKDIVIQKRQLLYVKEGERGLRQSEAVFQHVKNLPDMVDDIFLEFVGDLCAVGASSKPRDVAGSYMPCFNVGNGMARAIAKADKKRYYHFSHQQGHIAAALYSISRLDLLKEKFIAFHVSGGTMDAILCSKDKGLLTCETIGQSLDLHAGQLIDRVGVKMGLSFPCGKELEKLALNCHEEVEAFPCVKGFDCCMSGFENQAYDLLEYKDVEYVSKFVLMAVAETIVQMMVPINKKYGRIPVLFAGGVMSNSIIKDYIHHNIYSPVYFSLPEYATDNAVGITILTAIEDGINGN